MHRLFGLMTLLAMVLSTSYTAAASTQQEGSQSLGVFTIPTLNGALSNPNDFYSRLVIDLFQESLVDWRDNVLVGELADSVQPLDSEGVPHGYAFFLNPNVKWSDGVPLTADDIVFTFEKILDPELGSPYADQLRQALASQDALPAGVAQFATNGNDAVIVISNNVSEEDFLQALTVPIIPKHIWKDVPVDQWADDPGSTGINPDRVVGTGQYTFKSRIAYVDLDCLEPIDSDRPPDAPDEEIKLLRNPDYRTGKPLWGNYPEIDLKVYVCPAGAKGEFTPQMRLDVAIAGGIVSPRRLPELSIFDLTHPLGSVAIDVPHSNEAIDVPSSWEEEDSDIRDQVPHFRDQIPDIDFERPILAP